MELGNLRWHVHTWHRSSRAKDNKAVVRANDNKATEAPTRKKIHLEERIIRVMEVMKIKLKYFIIFLNFLNEDSVISLRNYSVVF